MNLCSIGYDQLSFLKINLCESDRDSVRAIFEGTRTSTELVV